mmetsp:Transcript_120868/g.385987  ORF Transcript_120868/g.385987 Transcript_120868/m.385987 type:complete len:1843 (+) Transcript_120868:184-5712(+)
MAGVQDFSAFLDAHKVPAHIIKDLKAEGIQSREDLADFFDDRPHIASFLKEKADVSELLRHAASRFSTCALPVPPRWPATGPRDIKELAEGVDCALVRLEPHAARWRAHSKVIAEGMAIISQCIVATGSLHGHGKLGSGGGQDAECFLHLMSSTLSVASLFGEQAHVQWILGPLMRLAHWLLLTVAIDDRIPSRSKQRAAEEFAKLLSTVPGKSVEWQMCQELLRILQEMLAQWAGSVLAGGFKIAVGIGTSLVTMNPLAGAKMLIEGTGNLFSGGFAYFKKLKADQQLALLIAVCSDRGGDGQASPDAAGAPKVRHELHEVGDILRKNRGNWLIEVSWVFRLHRTGKATLAQGASSGDMNWSAIRAVVEGSSDGAPGLCAMFSLTRGRPSLRGVASAGVQTLLSGLEDGEALVSVIVKVAEEAMSQLGEILRDEALAAVLKVLKDKLNELKHCEMTVEVRLDVRRFLENAEHQFSKASNGLKDISKHCDSAAKSLAGLRKVYAPILLGKRLSNEDREHLDSLGNHCLEAALGAIAAEPDNPEAALEALRTIVDRHSPADTMLSLSDELAKEFKGKQEKWDSRNINELIDFAVEKALRELETELKKRLNFSTLAEAFRAFAPEEDARCAFVDVSADAARTAIVRKSLRAAVDAAEPLLDGTAILAKALRRVDRGLEVAQRGLEIIERGLAVAVPVLSGVGAVLAGDAGGGSEEFQLEMWMRWAVKEFFPEAIDWGLLYGPEAQALSKARRMGTSENSEEFMQLLANLLIACGNSANLLIACGDSGQQSFLKRPWIPWKNDGACHFCSSIVALGQGLQSTEGGTCKHVCWSCVFDKLDPRLMSETSEVLAKRVELPPAELVRLERWDLRVVRAMGLLRQFQEAIVLLRQADVSEAGNRDLEVALGDAMNWLSESFRPWLGRLRSGATRVEILEFVLAEAGWEMNLQAKVKSSASDAASTVASAASAVGARANSAAAPIAAATAASAKESVASKKKAWYSGFSSYFSGSSSAEGNAGKPHPQRQAGHIGNMSHTTAGGCPMNLVKSVQELVQSYGVGQGKMAMHYGRLIVSKPKVDDEIWEKVKAAQARLRWATSTLPVVRAALREAYMICDALPSLHSRAQVLEDRTGKHAEGEQFWQGLWDIAEDMHVLQMIEPKLRAVVEEIKEGISEKLSENPFTSARVARTKTHISKEVVDAASKVLSMAKVGERALLKVQCSKEVYMACLMTLMAERLLEATAVRMGHTGSEFEKAADAVSRLARAVDGTQVASHFSLSAPFRGHGSDHEHIDVGLLIAQVSQRIASLRNWKGQSRDGIAMRICAKACCMLGTSLSAKWDGLAATGGSVMQEVKDMIENFKDDMTQGLTNALKSATESVAGEAASWLSNLGKLVGISGLGVAGQKAIREVAQTLVGPQEQPELVQEAIIAALLELAELLAQAPAPSADTTGDERARLLELVRRSLARAQWVATSPRCKALLEQDCYRQVMAEAVENTAHTEVPNCVEDVQESAEAQQDVLNKMEDLAEQEQRDDSKPTKETMNMRHCLADKVSTKANSVVSGAGSVRGRLSRMFGGGSIGLLPELSYIMEKQRRQVENNTTLLELILAKMDKELVVKHEHEHTHHHEHKHEHKHKDFHHHTFQRLPSNVAESSSTVKTQMKQEESRRKEAEEKLATAEQRREGLAISLLQETQKSAALERRSASLEAELAEVRKTTLRQHRALEWQMLDPRARQDESVAVAHLRSENMELRREVMLLRGFPAQTFGVVDNPSLGSSSDAGAAFQRWQVPSLSQDVPEASNRFGARSSSAQRPPSAVQQHPGRIRPVPPPPQRRPASADPRNRRPASAP